MADKEERIYIGIINPKGDFCPVPYGTCNSLCDNCKGGITLTEATERIAKAICKSDGICKNHDCENCTEWSGNDILVAEAALNALLGVEK